MESCSYVGETAEGRNHDKRVLGYMYLATYRQGPCPSTEPPQPQMFNRSMRLSASLVGIFRLAAIWRQRILLFLIGDEGRLGGFHFNNRKYADDDLIVGSVNPFELFLIFNELVAAEASNEPMPVTCAKGVAYMIDRTAIKAEPAK